jgi:carboxyl-terminal processing protease
MRRRSPFLNRTLLTVVAVIAVLGVFVAGIWVGGHPTSTGLDNLADGPRNFFLGPSARGQEADVLDLLEHHYYRPVDAAALQRSSIDGMLAALHDPYTQYLDPSQLQALRLDDAGQYTGVGLVVARRGGRVIVTGTFPGSPAAKAGIRAGDRLLAVDGRSVQGDVDAAVGRITGPAGTRVRLRVGRAGRPDPLAVTLERAEITVPPVAARIVTRNGVKLGVIRLQQFTRGAASLTRRAEQGLVGFGARAVVLDLRGDPGGLVDEAVGVAGAFLPKGTPVATIEGAHQKRTVLRTRGGQVPRHVPLVVLVNRRSASSSEIVAGALRDDGAAVLVGTRTFGKALVQTTLPLRGGGALKLTTARYLTPKGLDINHRGLRPSLRAVDDPRTKTDEALNRALAVAAARAK